MTVGWLLVDWSGSGRGSTATSCPGGLRLSAPLVSCFRWSMPSDMLFDLGPINPAPSQCWVDCVPVWLRAFVWKFNSKFDLCFKKQPRKLNFVICNPSGCLVPPGVLFLCLENGTSVGSCGGTVFTPASRAPQDAHVKMPIRLRG